MALGDVERPTAFRGLSGAEPLISDARQSGSSPLGGQHPRRRTRQGAHAAVPAAVSLARIAPGTAKRWGTLGAAPRLRRIPFEPESGLHTGLRHARLRVRHLLPEDSEWDKSRKLAIDVVFYT